jgi:uncharacterized protein (TIGR02145 family)
MKQYLFLQVLLFALFFNSCNDEKDKKGTVMIAGSEWSTYNLDVVTYANGDSIKHVEDTVEWSKLREGAWCYYENKEDSAFYGKLYNWYAVNDSRGLCPKGWHVATMEEWNAIVKRFGGDSSAATALKEQGRWLGPGVDVTNSSGFSAVPAGNRTVYGTFNGRTNSGVWWTADEADSLHAWARYMNRLHSIVGKRAGDKNNGLTCRCVKTATK